MAQEEVGLAEAIAALQAELAKAAEAGGGAEFQFPVTGVQLEFHVIVTRTAAAGGGVEFHVVEPGGSGHYAREDIQTVMVTLGAPVDRTGRPVKIAGDRILAYITPPPGPPIGDDDD